jgi:DNA-binding SARP family transcriptional activator/tetratricopeptide (TPR) repeat protein
VRFGLLGPLLIEIDGTAVVMSSGRQRTLLAALLLRTDQVVSADSLIRAAWDDDAPSNARATLQTHMARLRRTLVDHGAPGDLVVTQPPGYLIRAGSSEAVDVARFERLLDEARQAQTRDDPAAGAELLTRALDLWRGPALADIPSEVLQREVGVRLSERRLSALEQRIDADLRLGRHAAVVGELRTVTAEHPLRERFWAQLMLAQAGSGQQAAALEAHAEIRRRLNEELGVEPGADIQAAHRQVLRPQAQVRPVRAPSGPAHPPPAQLPSDAAAFTGRAGYLSRLDSVRDQQTTGVPIVTITGTPGVGKTALAVHWAHRVREHFPDGQVYVNLRGYASAAPVQPAEALAQFLRALGVPPERVPSDPDEAAGLYRSTLTGKRLLVVLDNTATVDQVRPLIPGSPGCFVLVTSRDRLSGLTARDGARRVTLDTLEPAEARELLARIAGADRIAAEPAAADELAAACGYLPLAVGIVAATLTDQPHRRIAELVGALTTGDRLDAMEIDGDEQSAVRATFRLSDAALPPAARRLFYLLGVIPGTDFTVDAAAAVAELAPARAESLLNLLVAAHLVQRSAAGRHTFHDLLRLYAAERARADHGDDGVRAAIRRLLDWQLRLADAAATAAYNSKLRVRLPAADALPGGFADSAEALSRLDDERANLALAVQYAAAHGPYAHAWMLADILRGYYFFRRLRIDWLTTARAGLAAAVAAGDARGQAAAWLSTGDAEMRFGTSERAVADLTQALTWSVRAGWPEGEANVVTMLGNVYLQLGQAEQATTHTVRAVELAEQSGRVVGHAAALGNLGNLLRDLGRLSEAADCQQRALALNRQAGSVFGESLALANLGEVYRGMGRTGPALEHLTEAMRLHRALGDDGGAAETQHMLAALYVDLGRPVEALAHARASLEFARDAGEARSEAYAAQALGTVHHAAGRWQEAADLYRRVVAVPPGLGDRYPAVEARIGLALACRRLGFGAEAVAHAEQAITEADGYGFRLLADRARAALSTVSGEDPSTPAGDADHTASGPAL